MSALTVEYRLPVSALRFSGTVTETTDTVLEESTCLRSGTVTLDVVGGKPLQTLKLHEGLLRDTVAAFSLTDDGRFVSADVTSTGQLGKVVLGAAAIAANVVGLFAGIPPGALAAVEPDAQKAADQLTPEEKVAKAYTDKFGRLANVRREYEKLVSDAIAQIATQSLRLLRPNTDWGERAEILNRLRTLEQQLPIWRAELDRLNAHYAAWRAGTLVQHSEQHEDVLTLDALRAAGVTIAGDGTVDFSGQPDGAHARKLWDGLGLVVTMPHEDANDIPQPTGENVMVVRSPRITTLSVYERGDDDKACLQRTVRQLVMDSACDHREIELQESWFAKRGAKLSFSALGALTGISEDDTSSAAALAETLGALPASVAGGLESAQKMRTAWSGLQNASLAEELERTKKEVELKQQQLTAAGLTATESEYAELERLKQQADILAKQKAIGDAALDPGGRQVAALKQQVDLLKNQKNLSEASRTLQAEQELYNLRLEIERLKAQKDLKDNQPRRPRRPSPRRPDDLTTPRHLRAAFTARAGWNP